MVEAVAGRVVLKKTVRRIASRRVIGAPLSDWYDGNIVACE
jgi:hypothetical protein